MLRFRPVLTFTGFVAVVLALVMLVKSLAARNAYEIVLAVAVLGVCLVLCIIGAWGASKLAILEPGWKPPAPVTAGTAEESLITGIDVPLPWFFRLHFVVKGHFFPAASPYGCPVRAETSTPPRGGGAARLNLSFPMSGVFHGEGFCRLRDIFGFFSFPCALPQRRTLMVRSAPCLKKPLLIEAYSGAEDRRNKTSSNEERYYMREYTPGDRFRDINWKSSDRINTLITRISPDNQEKISRIEVYFRNYGPSEASLEALWLLDRAKARLAQFLRAVREEQASYLIHVRAAEASWEIEDEDELDAFLEELAGIPFSPHQNEDTAGASAGASELYVFSTACDAGLPTFLLACQTRFVFLARPAAAETSVEEIEKLRVRDFAARGFIPSPHWLPRIKDRSIWILTPPHVHGRIEIDYAEVRL
ncbi:MAG: DUF58 domain-containing protein [Treponema sp.]|jgi:hypothetical protein|nr:DUF58 domain-containing protein [Treponema sp.]